MKYFFALALVALASPVFSFTLYGEANDKHALYAGVFAPELSLTGEFGFQAPEMFLDYTLPLGFPLSLGAFITAPEPNLKHFGARGAWHFNIGDAATDLYFFYVFDFGWIRNSLLVQYNDAPVEIRHYDFRAGVRRLFGRRFALSVETGYHLAAIRFGLAVKLN